VAPVAGPLRGLPPVQGKRYVEKLFVSIPEPSPAAAAATTAASEASAAPGSFPPAGACDCHLHVIGPKALYPLAARRAFTPRDATLEEMNAMHARLGIGRLVLVQTSVFGHDNRCMLDGLARLGGRARGVAVLADDTADGELDRLHRLGVRGLRVNVATYGSSPSRETAQRLQAAARLCARKGWHVQLFVGADALVALAPAISALPVDCVIDHFGLIPPEIPDHPARDALEALLGTGRVWVKISGAYRLGSGTGADVRDPAIGKLANRLYRINPERIVWGTDWPHTPVHGAVAQGDEEQPYRDIDPAALLEGLRVWFGGDMQALRHILVDNPSALYFADAPA